MANPEWRQLTKDDLVHGRLKTTFECAVVLQFRKPEQPRQRGLGTMQTQEGSGVMGNFVTDGIFKLQEGKWANRYAVFTAKQSNLPNCLGLHIKPREDGRGSYSSIVMNSLVMFMKEWGRTVLSLDGNMVLAESRKCLSLYAEEDSKFLRVGHPADREQIEQIVVFADGRAFLDRKITEHEWMSRITLEDFVD